MRLPPETRRPLPARLPLIIVTVILALLLTSCSAGAVTTPKTSNGLGNDAVTGATVVASGPGFQQPRDAAYDPDGNTIYFTATGSAGPAIFSVATTGGGPRELASGAPLATPQGIVVSSDGRTLYVADAGAAQGGALLQLPVTGGTPTVVAGTAGTAPQNLDLLRVGDKELIYFTGLDPANRQPALLSLPTDGSMPPSASFVGAPLAEPDGVAVAADLTVFVADRSGKVFKLSSDAPPIAVADKVKLGTSAGLALSLDEKVLLVSAIDERSKGDRVVLVDVASGRTGTVDKVIGTNKNSSGGLHRARNVATFAWADRTGGTGGRGQVYSVTTAAAQAAVPNPLQAPVITSAFYANGTLCIPASGSGIRFGATLSVSALLFGLPIENLRRGLPYSYGRESSMSPCGDDDRMRSTAPRR